MSTEQLQSTSPVQRTHVFQFSGASSALTLPSGVAVKFPENMSADERSRVEEVIARLREATVQVDAQGRISLALGNVADAHGEEETPSLSSSQPLSLSAQPETTQEDEESDEEHQAIFKHLEHFSCDEYDDFNPRHPLPKDRAHRRGDSYFNSDIEMVVGELGGQAVKPVDLSSIARAALEEPAPVPAAAAAPEGPTGAKSVKDRILARAKNNNAGAPPTRPKSLRAVNALNEGSDEEN